MKMESWGDKTGENNKEIRGGDHFLRLDDWLGVPFS